MNPPTSPTLQLFMFTSYTVKLWSHSQECWTRALQWATSNLSSLKEHMSVSYSHYMPIYGFLELCPNLSWLGNPGWGTLSLCTFAGKRKSDESHYWVLNTPPEVTWVTSSHILWAKGSQMAIPNHKGVEKSNPTICSKGEKPKPFDEQN